MRYADLIDLHNVAELNMDEGHDPRWHGQRMQRVPETVRQHLNEGAQARMLDGSGVELRFVANGPVRITLRAQAGGGDDPPRAMIFQGDYKVSSHRSFAKGLNVVEFEPDPVMIELKKRATEMRNGAIKTHTITPSFVFDPAVTRVMLPLGGGPWHIHRVEPAPGVTCRPPTAEELPKRRLLTYGTSITQGFAATLPHHAYAFHAARHLGADLINLGSSGSAHCEPELADYIAESGARGEWDLATLALSVNMQQFEPSEFRKRVSYMVDTVAGANPDKPVFAITLWSYFRDVAIIPKYVRAWDEAATKEPTHEIPARAKRMRQDLRDAVADAHAKGRDNLHLLEGPDLFGPFQGNSTDLIHPSDFGMMEMGRNLALAIRPHLTD